MLSAAQEGSPMSVVQALDRVLVNNLFFNLNCCTSITMVIGSHSVEP